jgi:hypothetical protein
LLAVERNHAGGAVDQRRTSVRRKSPGWSSGGLVRQEEVAVETEEVVGAEFG